MTLIEALKALDPQNDEHWTKEGSPLLNVLEQLAGKNYSRAEISAAAPDFSRTNPVIEGSAPSPWGHPQPNTVLMQGSLDSEKIEHGENFQGGTLDMQGMSPVEAAQARLQIAQTAMQDARKELVEAQTNYDKVINEHNRVNAVSHADIVKMAQASSIAEQQGQAAHMQRLQEMLKTNTPL